MSIKFTDLKVIERKSYVLMHKDLLPIHDIIAKHLNITASESILRYKLEANFIKNTLTISGDYNHIFNLLSEMQRFLTPDEFDSISQDYIRLDIFTFLNKII